jgi:hypothetical protein
MNETFFFWWSVVSTVIGILLLCFSLWQVKSAIDERRRNAAQVKIWMQDANGIQNSLQRVVIDNLGKRYGTTDDMANTIWSLQATAFALYQSLYEERCITEEEYKEMQRELREHVRNQQTMLGNEKKEPAK